VAVGEYLLGEGVGGAEWKTRAEARRDGSKKGRIEFVRESGTGKRVKGESFGVGTDTNVVSVWARKEGYSEVVLQKMRGGASARFRNRKVRVENRNAFGRILCSGERPEKLGSSGVKRGVDGRGRRKTGGERGRRGVRRVQMVDNRVVEGATERESRGNREEGGVEDPAGGRDGVVEV